MRRRPLVRATERSNFDAVATGARCGDCRFKALGAIPVQPKGGRGPLVIVDSFPTAYDDKAGHSVPTRASRLLDNTLESLNGSAHQTWATLCAPPETSDEADLKQAIGCCAPRLAAEVEQARTSLPGDSRQWILALGDEAFWATTGKSGSSESWKGSPINGILPGTKVLPSYQPRHVVSKDGRKLSKLFYKHVERALKFATGRLGDFVWPRDIVDDGPELEAALTTIALHAEAGGEYAFDIETRGLELTSDISCISFATTAVSCCVQLPTSARYDALIRRILRSGHSVGQNISAFDRRCLAAHGYVLTYFYDDTLLAASILDPQLPKNLGALVGAESHAEAHKASFKADKETGILQGDWLSTDPIVERNRRIYCLRDSYTTLLVWVVQQQRLEIYGKELYYTLKQLDRIMLRLRESGCEWDFLAAAELDVKYSEKRAEALAILKKAAASLGMPDFNPGSPKQVAELFYVKCGIPPFKWTDTGAPSTDEDVLTELLKSDNEYASKFAFKLLDFREADKALGTYIRGMAPASGARVYGEWRAHTTPTGRFSCTGVPLQTLSSEMRRLIRATGDKLIVEADLAGAELRTVALFAAETTMLQIFADGGDLYSIIARQMFQDDSIAKGHKLRQLAKVVILASNYGAAADTAYGIIVKDESIRKNFPNLTIREVKAMQNAYFKVCPRIPMWWEEEAEESLARGYYYDPLFGAKLDFWGPVDRSLMANFPNQDAVARYMNKALLRIDPQLDPANDVIITVVHDSITIETSKERIKLVESLLHKEMRGLLSYKGRSVDMIVESKIGSTLDAVK